MFSGGFGVKANVGGHGASLHIGADEHHEADHAAAADSTTKPKMKITVPEDLRGDVEMHDDIQHVPEAHDAVSKSLLEKAAQLKDEINNMALRCDQQDISRASAQLQMYYERINALQAEANGAKQRMSAAEVKKVEDNIAFLQHSYKELRNLVSLYGDTSSLEQLLANIDIEAVNRAVMTADQFRMRASDDGFVDALQKSCGKEDSNRHEQILNRDVSAVTDVWRNMQKLARCVTHHVDNAALHAQFYATAHDYDRLMPSAICATRRSLWFADVKTPAEDANGDLTSNELFGAFDELLYTLTCWWQRVQQLAARSRKLNAVAARSQIGTPAIRLPAKVLSDFDSDETCLKKDETVFVVEQLDRSRWVVETTRHHRVTVPAIVCAIVSPDVQAIEQTLKVKRSLLLEWTLAVRDCAAQAALVLLNSFQHARQIATEHNVQFAAFDEPSEDHQIREAVRNVMTEAEGALARGEAVRHLFDENSSRLFIETDFVDAKTGALYNPAQLRSANPAAKLHGFNRLLARRLFEWRTVADFLQFEHDASLLDEHSALNSRHIANSAALYADLIAEIDAFVTLFEHASILFQIEPSTAADDATLNDMLAAHTISDDAIKRFQQVYRVWQLVRRELETSDSAADEVTGELLALRERAGTADEQSLEQLETNLEELIQMLLADEADDQEVAQNLDSKLRLLLRYYTDRKKMEKRSSFLFDDSAQRYVLEASRPDLEEFRDIVTEKQQLYIDVSTGTIFAEADYSAQPARRAKKDAQLDVYFGNTHALDEAKPEVEVEDAFDEPLVTNEYKLVVNAGDQCECDLHRYRPRVVKTWQSDYSNAAAKNDDYDNVPPEFIGAPAVAEPVSNSRPTSRPESRASQTDPQDELVKAPCIATQTAETVPFAARPKKGNLKIIAVYDTLQKEYVSKKDAHKLGILNKETKQFWNRRKNQYIWVGDAIVKGFIRLGVKTATGAPYSDLTVQPVKREKKDRSGSVGDDMETASQASSTDGQASHRLRVRPRI